MAEKSEINDVAKKKKYVTPNTEKHEPLSIVRGSGGGVSLYHECSLYYYY
ncbi:MAG: hypothetical protein V2B20_04105 [Pseudomonadota bacterium]